MFKKEAPLAIIDSGVGGLTVVKELQTLLPQENIVYFGDNKNVPYGSKSQDEITKLTNQILRFLVKYEIKLVGIGCNTISTVLDFLEPQFSLEIIGIINPVVEHLAKLKESKVGLIATPFTINSQYYDQTLAKVNPNMEIVGESCPNLAPLIDKGNYLKEQVYEEIADPMLKLKARGAADTIVLGCTHYPIVSVDLQDLYPSTNFINPAYYQALAIKNYLTNNHLLNNNELAGDFNVFTTGEVANYQEFLIRLGISNVRSINKVKGI